MKYETKCLHAGYHPKNAEPTDIIRDLEKAFAEIH